jgi:hypothetical protein
VTSDGAQQVEPAPSDEQLVSDEQPCDHPDLSPMRDVQSLVPRPVRPLQPVAAAATPVAPAPTRLRLRYRVALLAASLILLGQAPAGHLLRLPASTAALPLCVLIILNNQPRGRHRYPSRWHD